MADINATDLTPETAATLDGSEEFVMFDNVEGKRGELDTVGDYIVQHCDADGNGNTAAQLAGGAQADATAALGDIGDISDLITTDKTDLVSAVNEVKGQADDNTTALQTKAEVDGAYESMTVGNAEQLVSNIRVTDTDPYLFRTAGGSLEIGDREYPTLVGGTVAWNQLIEQSLNTSGLYNATKSYNSTTNELTLTPVDYTKSGGAYLTQATIPNHVYVTMADVYLDHDGRIGLGIEGTVPNVDLDGNKWNKIERIDKPAGTASFVAYYIHNVPWTSGSFKIRNVQFIDLTAYFGSSTIADYIYTLEQGTAGAGVAFCKKYGIGVGYTAYNAGTLQSTTPTKHKTVGFNQWDEEWESGLYNVSTGEKVNNGNYIRSKNLVKVLPNTEYYLKTTVGENYLVCFDRNGNFVSTIIKATSGTFTTPANVYFIGLDFLGTTYNNDICINLHWDGERDGEYEPYTKHEYDLGNDTLRGVFELNNGELKANGDVKSADGTITRKYGIVDLGTLTWFTHLSVSGVFYCRPADMKVTSSDEDRMTGLMCADFIVASLPSISASMEDKTCLRHNGAFYVRYNAHAGDTAEQFKAAMSGVYLVYELATPTEEEGTAFQSPQIVSNWGTEEYTEANGIVVGHSTEYPQDLKAKVESAPNNPSADGEYIVKRENGENAYVPLVIPQELPNAPSTDGTYRLKCTVSGGAATYSWEA